MGEKKSVVPAVWSDVANLRLTPLQDTSKVWSADTAIASSPAPTIAIWCSARPSTVGSLRRRLVLTLSS